MRLAATDTPAAVKRRDVKPVNKVKILPVNDGMPLKPAAAQYDTVRSILRYRVNAGIHKNTGSLQLLFPEKYAELYHRMFWVAEIRLPVTGTLWRTNGYTYCELNVVMYNFNDKSELTGRKLISETASECAKTKAQAINQEAKKLNRVAAKDYFERPKSVPAETDL